MDPLADAYYSISPYAFTGNDPVSNIDPDGRSFFKSNFLNQNGGHWTDKIEGWQSASDRADSDQGKRDAQKEKELKFKELWNAYPTGGIDHKDSNGKECFDNQCAIRVSHALIENGFQPGGTKCWSCSVNKKHSIRANELAKWLLNNQITGIESAIIVTGKNFFEKVKGKKGIIFFENYWRRSSDPQGTRTGDHIDLWWGKTLKGNGVFKSWIRRRFPGFSESWLDMSDLEKSTKVIFWEIKN